VLDSTLVWFNTWFTLTRAPSRTRLWYYGWNL